MKTMQKNKGLKKRGKGLALGICAAILGTVGVAWIPQTVAWAYAESYICLLYTSPSPRDCS